MFDTLGNFTRSIFMEFLNRLSSVELNDEEADYLIKRIEERRRAGK